MSMSVKRKFRVEQREKGRKEVRRGEAKPEVPVERVPRVSRLMALAIRFDEMIRNGEVKDQAELARLGHVSRARLSQILNLLNHSPQLQESLLSLPAVVAGKDSLSELDVRSIVGEPNWQQQMRLASTHLRTNHSPPLASDRPS